MSKRVVPFLAPALLLMTACGPTPITGDDDGPDASTEGCSVGQTRCSGPSYQECVDGLWQEQDLCLDGQVCDSTLACVDCRPDSATMCVGTEVHTCEANGTIGGLVEDCGTAGCTGGHCSGDCADGTALVYVVDADNRLWSFDPEVQPASPSTSFQLIGNLSCPAGISLGDGTSTATPFSMSVDRDGRAWVLYSSGEIFWVDIDDASCQSSGFTPQQNGFDLFGMGFVTDSPGSNQETLFVSGGSVSGTGAGNLGWIDTDSLVLTSLGTLPTADHNPELTGTGNAELFGYYPSDVGTNRVAQISKANGANLATWDLSAVCSGLLCSIRAWAFAHWGGQFYVFVTTTDGLTLADTAKVIRLDPETGTNQVIPGLEDTGTIVVGAGVSTCAPIYVP